VVDVRIGSRQLLPFLQRPEKSGRRDGKTMPLKLPDGCLNSIRTVARDVPGQRRNVRHTAIKDRDLDRSVEDFPDRDLNGERLVVPCSFGEIRLSQARHVADFSYVRERRHPLHHAAVCANGDKAKSANVDALCEVNRHLQGMKILCEIYEDALPFLTLPGVEHDFKQCTHPGREGATNAVPWGDEAKVFQFDEIACRATCHPICPPVLPVRGTPAADPQ
jgi:hypothetical protein